jgi:hypothetical protein
MMVKVAMRHVWLPIGTKTATGKPLKPNVCLMRWTHFCVCLWTSYINNERSTWSYFWTDFLSVVFVVQCTSVHFMQLTVIRDASIKIYGKWFEDGSESPFTHAFATNTYYGNDPIYTIIRSIRILYHKNRKPDLFFFHQVRGSFFGVESHQQQAL